MPIWWGEKREQDLHEGERVVDRLGLQIRKLKLTAAWHEQAPFQWDWQSAVKSSLDELGRRRNNEQP